MVYLLGGYLLTTEQVFDFAKLKDFEIPCTEAITLCSNQWLKCQGVHFRLKAVYYQRQLHILLVTKAKYTGSDETKDNFTPFSERPEVKGKMVEWDERLRDVEHVTIANPSVR
jgi:hypothetical protein